jgi:hypothetical protein
MKGCVMTMATTTSTQPRLLDRVRAAARVRHYSRRTEVAYVHWIRRFIWFHACAPAGATERVFRHPKDLGAADINAFLTSLAAVSLSSRAGG